MRNDLMMHIFTIIWAMWRRRYLICVPILLMPIVGLITGLLSPKKYETYTTILIQETSKQNPFLEDLAVETNLKSRMDALNALLHSRHILTEVAVKLGIIDKEMQETDRRKKIAKLSKSLKSTLVGEDLIKITYTSDDPTDMSEVLKLVSLRFVERVIAPQRSSIIKSESFLESEMQKRIEGLTIAEQKLAAYKKDNSHELPELNNQNISKLSHVRSVLAEKRIALEGAKAAEQKLKERLSQTNPVVGKIEEKIIETMAKLTSLRSRYTDKHTKVQAALNRLSALETERKKLLLTGPKLANLEGENLDRLWNMATTNGFDSSNGVQTLLVSQLEKLQDAQSQCDRLKEEVASLEQELSILTVKAKGFSEHERRINELQREINIQRKIYGDLAERHQLARVTGALGKSEESERVKLIDPPFTPIAPSNLPLIMFILSGMISGIFLGLGLAFVFEILDSSIRQKSVLEKIINAPVITRIPQLKEQNQ